MMPKLDTDAWLAEQLEEYRRNFEVGDDQSRRLAYLLCTGNRRPLPEWLAVAMDDPNRSRGRGRANSRHWPARMARVHAIRWNYVSHCKWLMRPSVEAWQAIPARTQDAMRRRSPDAGYHRERSLATEDNPDPLYECTDRGAYELAHDKMEAARSPALASTEAIGESYRKVQEAIDSGEARLYMAALNQFSD